MFSWETLHSIAVGGVATHVTELAAALERRGHEVHVFTRPGCGLGSVQRIDGVWYHYCPHNFNRNFVDEMQEMCRSFVCHFFATEDEIGSFEIVHAHDWLASNAIISIKQSRPAHRALLTMHSTEYGRCGNDFWNGVSIRIRDQERRGIECADQVIAVSGMLKGELMWMYNLQDGKCRVIYNGVPVHKFDGFIDAGAVKRRYGIGPLDPMVLFSGRLSLQKGPDLLLEAVPGLLRYYPRAKFVFAGDGHMRAELERRAQQLRVAHSTRFLGYRNGEELSDLYKACDAVCLPSRNEPFGITALEGWAAGKPAVASQVGGPNEFIWHGVTGLKIYPTVDSVGWGIGTLFTNFDWARWMGANGRRAAEVAFTWDVVAEKNRELLPLMSDLAEYLDHLPNICGSEPRLETAIRADRGKPIFLPESGIDFGRVRSAFAIALHMHQPLIPAGCGDLATAEIISNLKHMMDNPHIGDNHNAPVFLQCYRRMGEFIPQLLGEGKQPRVMLEYSGTLLHGLRQMGAHEVLDSLKMITCDSRYRHAVEWLGCPWGHAVAPSTPVQDYRLHVIAWQHHFAAIFGLEALSRVRGFSPAEMALPNHPDVAYDFVKTLKDCGYDWVLVQEHSVERPETGSSPERKHIPHRLVCRNSRGEEASIVAIIKTQGSDTKLIGQMQPYYEAKGLSRWELAGKYIPPLVTQISDGENGGVMMNEFPSKYFEVVRESSGSVTPGMNVTEYLEHLSAMGVRESEFPTLQPLFQKRIWDRFRPGEDTEKLASVIDRLKKEDHRFHVEGGSWTNNISWIRGYDSLLGPMERASSHFFQKVLNADIPRDERRYRNALFHLLCSQTSCYRYWGSGIWTEYGREICRRLEAILAHDFPEVPNAVAR